MPKYYCVAEGCPADERKRGKYGFMASVRFFPFPSKKNPRLRKRWVDLVRRANFDPTRNDRLCSLHFEDGEPTISSPYPTLFSYNNFKEKEDRRGVVSITKRVNCVSTNETGTSSSQTDSLDAVMMDCDGTPSAFCIPVANEVIIRTTTDKVSQIAAPVDHDYAERRQHIQTTLKNTETQTDIKGIDLDAMTTKIDDLEAKLEDKDSLLRENFVHKVTSSDAAVKRYLGLPSLMALLGLFAILDKISPALKYWRGSGGTHHQTKYQEDKRKRKSGPTRKLTRFHEILLTILRLRLALPLFVLADIFGVSVTRASQIFTTWVNFMHVVFSPMIKWPKSKRVRKFLPGSFKRSFPKTTCIIDCTEIFIQRPHTPTAQITTYSSYKHHNTFKLLVAVTPTGAFSFVSNLWGGNVSDRYITEHSGFLDHIRQGDEVMADRGFLIRDLLLERRATLNIPPFTKKCQWGKGKCLTAKDITRTKNIAKQRIHVERAIGRLKTFKLLSNTMPLKLKPLANQIVNVCAFFCNLHPPLVKK